VGVKILEECLDELSTSGIGMESRTAPFTLGLSKGSSGLRLGG